MRNNIAEAELPPARRHQWRWLVGDRSKLLFGPIEAAHRTHVRALASAMSPAPGPDLPANRVPPGPSKSLYHRRSDESAAAAAGSRNPVIAAIYRDCSRVWLLMAEYNENCLCPRREPSASSWQSFNAGDEVDHRQALTTADLDDILVAVQDAMN